MRQQEIKTLEAKTRKLQTLLDNYEDILDDITPTLFSRIENKLSKYRRELSSLYSLDRIETEIEETNAKLSNDENATIWYELNDYLNFLEKDKSYYEKLIGAKQ
jgi:hypothetical protein